MVDEIRELVRETCASETNIHGYGAWSHHIVTAIKCAKQLAKKIERSWKKMMPEAQEMISGRYKAVRKFLSPARRAIKY